jgi:hypothetical protein
MIYTRGMSIGSDLPTTGNFWVSMLEDGLPILPVRYNGMQDGNFYRADISTNRVEAVRAAPRACRCRPRQAACSTS